VATAAVCEALPIATPVSAAIVQGAVVSTTRTGNAIDGDAEGLVGVEPIAQLTDGNGDGGATAAGCSSTVSTVTDPPGAAV
jgi:hypothetical protein